MLAAVILLYGIVAFCVVLMQARQAGSGGGGAAATAVVLALITMILIMQWMSPSDREEVENFADEPAPTFVNDTGSRPPSSSSSRHKKSRPPSSSSSRHTSRPPSSSSSRHTSRPPSSSSSRHTSRPPSSSSRHTSRPPSSSSHPRHEHPPPQVSARTSRRHVAQSASSAAPVVLPVVAVPVPPVAPMVVSPPPPPPPPLPPPPPPPQPPLPPPPSQQQQQVKIVSSGAAAPPLADGDLEGPLSEMPTGLVCYTTCFLASSYPGSGKLWRNLAAAANPANPANPASSDPNLYFQSEPAFSRQEGASMGDNSVSGPLTYTLGIKGDLSFSVVVLCQFLGVVSSSADVVLLRLYANTPDNNGFCIFMRNFAALPGNMISGDMYVSFGSAPPMRCSTPSSEGSCGGGASPLVLDTTKQYMLVACKGKGRMRVQLLTVGSAATVDSLLILDGKVAHRESVVFSNREMAINSSQNWNANLMALAIFNRALADTDVHALCSHYTAVFRRLDPAYQAMLASLQQATSGKACPFNQTTCSACAAVTDFTDPKLIISSSDQCLSSIDAFCTSNPGHPTCWCWDTKNPYYAGRCKDYRHMFGGPNSSSTTASSSSSSNPNTPVTLRHIAASNRTVDGQGRASAAAMKSIIASSATNSNINSGVTPAGSKDAVQAMLAVLSDLKRTIPQSTSAGSSAAAAAAAPLAAAASATPPTPTPIPIQTPTLTQTPIVGSRPAAAAAPAKKSFGKWLFGM